ncbi:hypothetical protein Tco_0952271 [Tanacetum coccineum]|uniref:Uncharacterized protein n=1 Tax=Tanacetum coccineum TaxID=301880 RepID=A0ABQ5DWG0_9ASTR
MGSREGPFEPAQLAQTTPSSAFIKENINMLRTMIKEHDQQAKVKVSPKKLFCGEEDLDILGTKGILKRLSNESFGTTGTRDRSHSSGKSLRSLSRSRVSSHLRSSERLENRSKSKAKSRERGTKSRGKRSEPKEASPDTDYEEDSKDTCEYLITPYKRPKPTPFTIRITRFKYHVKAKLPRNVKVYEGSKHPEDHLGIISTDAEQEEWPMKIWCKMFDVFQKL